VSQQPLFEVDPHVRREDDFYRTPVWQTQALLARVPILVQPSHLRARVVEPCVGDGAIVGQFPAGVDVLTNDIVARGDIVPEFLLDARNRGSWDAFCRTGRLDVVVTNPPFNDAFEIVQHAVERAYWGVAMLLRLSWLEPTEDRGPWLAVHPPTHLIVMPRYDYRQNGATDSVTSAWMLWDSGRMEFGAPGIDIVTKAERDRLVAKYGDR